MPRSLIFSSCSTLPSTTPTPHTFPLPPTPPPTPNPRLYLTSPEVFETFDFPRLKRVLFASGYWLSISADRSAREGELGLLVAMISEPVSFNFTRCAWYCELRNSNKRFQPVLKANLQILRRRQVFNHRRTYLTTGLFHPPSSNFGDRKVAMAVAVWG